MLNQKSLLVVTLTAAAGVQALSSGCKTQIGALALTGDLSSCLQLGSLLPVLSSGSGSIVDSINSYLTSLCGSSTPKCSNSTLSSAQSSISSACSSDLSGGGSGATEIQALQQVLMHYDNVYAAACSKNTTNNDYCVTSTLTQIQTDTNTNISTSYLTGLLSGSGLQQLQQEVQTGHLCTGCVQEIYQQAVKANGSIANSAVASGLSQQCGSSFISTDTTPSGVQVGSASSSAASGSGSSGSNTSGAASSAYGLPSFTTPLIGGSVMLVAAAFGGALVL